MSSEACTFTGLDLIVVDLLESLHVPNVSSPPQSTSFWNVHKSKIIEVLVEFAFVYLTDDGPLLLFFPKKKDVKDNVRTYAAYDLYCRRIGGVLVNCHCALQWTRLDYTFLTLLLFCILFFSIFILYAQFHFVLS